MGRGVGVGAEQIPRYGTLYGHWVNPSKKGGINNVFQGLAGQVQGFTPRKTPSFPTLLIRFTLYFK